MEITTELSLTQAAAAAASFHLFDPGDFDTSVVQPKPDRAEVNRANAALSTGPRTEEGKAASAQNSFKHGLTSTTFSLLPSEDATVFAQLVEGLTAEYAPQSTEENLLVEKIARQHWLSLRATNVQTTCFHDDGSLNERRLSLAIRYLNAHERLLRESVAELRQVQSVRRRQQACSAHAAASGFVSQLSPQPLPSTPPPASSAPQTQATTQPQRTLNRRERRKQERKNRR